MASAAGGSAVVYSLAVFVAVVYSLAVFCCSHCLWGLSVWSLFCFAVLCVLSNFAIISRGKRELVALLQVVVF